MSDSAVLTGDLIGSTLTAPEATDRAMDTLKDAAAILTRIAGSDTRFTRFRGDGWQMVLTDPGLTLRAVLLVTARLRAGGAGLATRIAVGVGAVHHLGTADLSDASGPAFSASGRALDQMTGTLAYSDRRDGGSLRGAILELAGWHARSWSAEQAEAAAMALDLPRPADAELARRLGITRQAFQARLKGAGLSALVPALAAMEEGRKEQEI